MAPGKSEAAAAGKLAEEFAARWPCLGTLRRLQRPGCGQLATHRTSTSPPPLSPRGDLRSTLYLNLCGETKVVRGTEYGYTAVLANLGKKTFRNIEVRIYHYDPITRASKPFGRVNDGLTGPGMTAAVWKLKSLKPRHTFRVGITLPFIQHVDTVGSNLHIRISGPKVRGGFTYDVFYVP